jgi:hypothetical protein
MALLYIRTLPVLPEQGPNLLVKHIIEMTCNIDRMFIRHHTHCSVESVAERGAAGPSLSSVRGSGRRVIET